MISKEQVKENRITLGKKLTECASDLGISYAKLWKMEAGKEPIRKYDDLALRQYFSEVTPKKEQ